MSRNDLDLLAKIERASEEVRDDNDDARSNACKDENFDDKKDGDVDVNTADTDDSSDEDAHDKDDVDDLDDDNQSYLCRLDYEKRKYLIKRDALFTWYRKMEARRSSIFSQLQKKMSKSRSVNRPLRNTGRDERFSDSNEDDAPPRRYYENDYHCQECSYKTYTKLNLLIHYHRSHGDCAFNMADIENDSAPLQSKTTPQELSSKRRSLNPDGNHQEKEGAPVIETRRRRLNHHVVLQHQQQHRCRCSLCGHVARSNVALDMHRRWMHYSVVCKGQQKGENNIESKLRDLKLTLETPSFSCKYCQFVGNSKATLEEHMCKNHLSRHIKCQVCKFRYELKEESENNNVDTTNTDTPISPGDQRRPTVQ